MIQLEFAPSKSGNINTENFLAQRILDQYVTGCLIKNAVFDSSNAVLHSVNPILICINAIFHPTNAVWISINAVFNCVDSIFDCTNAVFNGIGSVFNGVDSILNPINAVFCSINAVTYPIDAVLCSINAMVCSVDALASRIGRIQNSNDAESTSLVGVIRSILAIAIMPFPIMKLMRYVGTNASYARRAIAQIMFVDVEKRCPATAQLVQSTVL